ncbi:MAG: hypothetical protein E7586_00915 [Ruminococcaceae bacterium]|nr:hypothetical protein [Oscillospiraceae bacterium]
MTKILKSLVLLTVVLSLLLCGCVERYVPDFAQSSQTSQPQENERIANLKNGIIDLSEIPDFSGSPYYVINNNIPNFTKGELEESAFEYYSELDSLGRCQGVIACVGRDTMPTEPRDEIGMVKPTGWQISKYESVDGKYLYNRCHLIGFQLTGENANEKNLITGTRYMNVQGMLPFENQIADFVKDTGKHVLYRVTPVFSGDDLVARGVHLEALSVEDGGEGVCFNVFCYNVQPRIAIDYSNGDNDYAGIDDYELNSGIKFIINTASKKFHIPSCDAVENIKESNRETTAKSRSALISEGYSPCGGCNP